MNPDNKPLKKRIENIAQFSRAENYNHRWYLECTETHKYLMETPYSESLVAYNTRLGAGAKPVCFTHFRDAYIHAESQTRKHLKHLYIRPIGDFFLQYVSGVYHPETDEMKARRNYLAVLDDLAIELVEDEVSDE